MQHSAADADLVDLGRRLGAKWVVDGGYQRASELLRITFRLFDVGAVKLPTWAGSMAFGKRYSRFKTVLSMSLVRSALVHRPNSYLHYCGFRLELLVYAESRSRCLARPRYQGHAGPPGAVDVHSARPGAAVPHHLGGRCGQDESANRWRRADAGSDGE
jgi:hypothetical protein